MVIFYAGRATNVDSAMCLLADEGCLVITVGFESSIWSSNLSQKEVYFALFASLPWLPLLANATSAPQLITARPHPTLPFLWPSHLLLLLRPAAGRQHTLQLYIQR